MRPSIPLALVVTLGVLFSTACQSRRHRFIFHPSPNEILVQPGGDRVLARALVSIKLGERRESDDVPEMVVGLRIENNTDAPIRLIESQSLLVGSDVSSFGIARMTTGSAEAIPAGGHATYELRFPYPQHMRLSARDLNGLNLRFALE
ncbi:MAG: hypothetical protein ACI841_001312, partial [Planctomycetota bacterium]